ncbi:putative esterase [Monocercomonoides exilis]|uniref:putative esterase n=1 Tax=Monocercomonoides exilis TaxID=2049356 RepID=UPI0035596FE2|nr:putative esterase [Monocercomonoides exilis]|eukprot:MONOS_3656.1-p1 / transcript=MONOS_3656.1 / gene=MONOS_3656 / organism=Monocercomonoides_exilis_PA203 / gene_product=esterase / transcript_product=esterase / location=Mono_scaffold00088:51365-52297(+) / protein_length=311 / sequence_SO=supercontig / SO=protein_coding / is_pseudo=false
MSSGLLPELQFARFLKIGKLCIQAWMIHSVNLCGKIWFKLCSRPKDISCSTVKIKGYQDSNVEILIYSPKGLTDDAPCLVYYHGGAFFLGDFPMIHTLCFEYARAAKCRVAFVRYTLSITRPFPGPIEDCYSALEWISDHATELKIDPKRIAVGGDSAGGCISAVVSQMARDRHGPHICFQMLIYPVIDNTQSLPSAKNMTDAPITHPRLVRKMWQIYLRDMKNSSLPYSCALRTESFKDLPPAFIEVEDLDSLKDEGIFYSHCLSKAGVPVQLVQMKGTFHAFDIFVGKQVTKLAVKNRVKALKAAFRK